MWSKNRNYFCVMTPTNSSKKIICIVGGGPAGMLAAIELSKTHEVHLYEQGKTLGRKFLVAGKGGFNLSNQHKGFELIEKYDPSSYFTPILEKFDTSKTRNFLKDLDIPTFVGSSGRIFPKPGIKPIAVLNAFKDRLIDQGVRFHFEHKFVDFTNEQIVFQTPKEKIVTSFDCCIFALGGASWSVTGSKGDWRAIFESKGIRTKPFIPSNCGVHVQGFTSQLIEDFEGTPLKNIAIRCRDTIVKGEAVLTPYGFEGNAIYPMAALLGKELKTHGKTSIFIDFKPFNTPAELLKKIGNTTKPKNYGYLFKLSKVQLALLKNFTDKITYTTPALLVKKIKNLEIPVTHLRPLEEAISCKGGISLDELNQELALKKIPNIYIAGEMFDWDTITGGYLLQGCFATAYSVAQAILKN